MVSASASAASFPSESLRPVASNTMPTVRVSGAGAIATGVPVTTAGDVLGVASMSRCNAGGVLAGVAASRRAVRDATHSTRAACRRLATRHACDLLQQSVSDVGMGRGNYLRDGATIKVSLVIPARVCILLML